MSKNLSHKKSLPPALPGFNAIRRFWDPAHGKISAKIQPGEVYVTVSGELISTVLGSCISVCMYDPAAGVAGMNHFMLPRDKTDKNTIDKCSNPARYGNWAMEFLINEMLKAGAKKDRLETKIFGGGKVLADMEFMDIGQRNIDFVFSYLVQEGLHIGPKDVGGEYPRKVLFFGDTGQVKVKKIKERKDQNISGRERDYAKVITAAPKQGDITLFD
ncbi:MAG: chemoreceptor glutamine deamidase CheD [Gammaproteobacteria bacterium]|nr:chemoreceptor glutamine deamidase CheD [Gammaproteobacteria bacterium]